MHSQPEMAREALLVHRDRKLGVLCAILVEAKLLFVVLLVSPEPVVCAGDLPVGLLAGRIDGERLLVNGNRFFAGIHLDSPVVERIRLPGELPDDSLLGR